MFERRLRLIMLLMVLPAIAVIARLAQLQILKGNYYQATSEAMLIKPIRLYPCLRGEIVDCEGTRLAYDAESWNICVHYGILSGDEDHLRAMSRDRLKLRRFLRVPQRPRQFCHGPRALIKHRRNHWRRGRGRRPNRPAEPDRLAPQIRRFEAVRCAAHIAAGRRGG